MLSRVPGSEKRLYDQENIIYSNNISLNVQNFRRFSAKFHRQ